MKTHIIFVCFLIVIHGAWAPSTANEQLLLEHGGNRDGLISAYFRQGYSYKDIVLFLASIHGFKIGVDRLKQILRRLRLRRREPQNQETVQRVVAAVQSEMEESGNYILILRKPYVNFMEIFSKVCVNLT